ncbi:MAG: biopolymer transporter ExbD [Bacteroidales bacterium]|nr:biopolymer transporter ExbD [Lentimicrobiaceae bacterium]MBQ2852971.1 biopolymer transporter ExbD [Bacteroidales bacterium]MBR7176227.1 biopolymer transporter ExbD [Bacteroidales bacterium]
MAKQKKKVPDLNAGSMADISFLLLIFFLVTTTMDTDSGITRRLPPPVENPEMDVKVKERNIMNVLINKYDKLLVNGKPGDVATLKDMTKEFITPRPSDEKAPEVEVKDIELIPEAVMISKGVVSLKNDRGTSYSMYISVQNELAKAFNERKDELSLRYFNQHFADLTDKDKIEAINKAVPVRISEAEPEEIK